MLVRCLVYHTTLAPSTHINIFLNLQLFLSGYLQLFISGLKNFLSTSSVFKLNLPGIWIHSGETRPTCCLAILVYCLVREWTRFWLVIGLKNIWVCCSHVIMLVADLFFPLCRAGPKYVGSLMNLPDACGQEAYPGRKSCRLKIIQMHVDGATTVLNYSTVACIT